GVELDATTAAIARALYPSAHIRAEGFETTRLPQGSFVAAVGNVPFADVRLHDPAYNAGRHSMHNHFLSKSLQLVAPGGMVAAVTSRYTMDAQNPAARRELASYGDLVAAIRLPNEAFRQVAGTSVATDVLFLRRREADREPANVDWLKSVPVDIDGEQVRINQYFADRPQLMLGQLRLGSGMYGRELRVDRADVGAAGRL